MTKNNKWLFILLLAPLFAAQIMHNTSIWSLLLHTCLSASLVILFNAAQQQTKWFRRLSKILLTGFYFIFVFMLIFEVILFDFTGNGFTNEVYFHFELESLRIGFYEYPLQLLAFVFLVFIYIFLINMLIKKNKQPSKHLITLTALFVLFIGTVFSSVARFASGFKSYLWQTPMALNENLINQFIDLGVLQNSIITTKKQLKASVTNNSKNLILVYLESFNEGLLHLEEYPNLTPNLNELSQTYQKLNHLSSSYVTIEGIVSSQCGIMLPMTAGSNTFLNEGRLLSNMPCLGDVLNHAGYSQYYLGGAQMEFAGKGLFLETHGYNYIWGLEHWKAQGLKVPHGEWGLSDNVLFENALNTIKNAAKNPPFNVSLLTLGTHIPGFTYDGCKPYLHSDELFIDAIHCTDQLVGNFVAELEENLLLDDTVLMIVGDHGVFPNKQMRTLFSDVVDDRRLIGITNYPMKNKDTTLSSYDLAPTLLDMLGVKHNADFIFGQSHVRPSLQNQQHITRFGNWYETELINNSDGDCNEDGTINWPLNSCQKKQLLGITTQLLELYSIKEKPEQLLCEIKLKYTNEADDISSKNWTLLLNDTNHFDHFYSNGFTLKTRHVNSGTFVFVLNSQQQIEQHMFFKYNEKEQSTFKSFMLHNTKTLLIIKAEINVEDDLSDTLEIELYHKQKRIWLNQTTTHTSENVNICDFT